MPIQAKGAPIPGVNRFLTRLLTGQVFVIRLSRWGPVYVDTLSDDSDHGGWSDHVMLHPRGDRECEVIVSR
jgi:hypothetical protein